MGSLSDNLGWSGIGSAILLAKANPYIATSAGVLIGLEGLNASKVSSLFNQVALDYLGQSQKKWPIPNNSRS